MTDKAQLPAKLRPLDAMEKVFWLFDQHRPKHFCLVAELNGATTPDLWREALGHVGRQTPFAGTQIHVDENGSPYFSELRARPVPLTAIAGEADDWARHVAHELSVAFDVAADPLVRALLLHEPERCTLILTFHHAAFDGSSSAIFMRHVLSAAGGSEVVVSQITTSIEQAVEEMGWSTRDIPGDGDPNLSPPKFGVASTAPAVVAGRCLSIEATAALRDRARREGTSVHAALVVATADAYAALRPDNHPNPARVFTPIDARRRLLDPNEALGVFVSGIVTRATEPTDGFWSAARTITAKFASLGDPAVLASKVEVVRAIMEDVSSPQITADLFAKIFGAELLVTNLAAIDMPERFGKLTVDHLWGPSLSFGIECEQVVGVVTVGGRMHLLHTSLEFVDGLLEGIIDALTASTEQEVHQGRPPAASGML